MKEIIKEKIREKVNEVLITLGGKAYPNNGNVVIFAGGSASGKGFVKDNLLGLEGKVIDTDQLKELYLKSLKLKTALQNDYGLNVNEFDFKNPNDVNKLHQILSAKGVNAKRIDILSNTIKNISLKPNIIFDTTLSSLTTFNNLTTMIREMGYEMKNVHLVWVVTEYQTALKNNKKRDRVVPTIVFKDIHKGVSRTINELIQLPDLSNFMDGDIWFAFNNPVTDTNIQKSDLGGQYISQANVIKLKSSGQPMKPYNQIENEIIDRVNSYVHKKSQWEK